MSEESVSEKRLDAYLNGNISESEMAILDEEIRNDPKLRSEFRARVKMHSLLVDHYELESGSSGIVFPDFKTKEPRPVSTKAILAIAAVVALSLALLFVFQREASGTESMAQISGEKSATWATGKIPKTGEFIGNERYEILAGLIELALPSGVRVAIEGPAEFRFLSATRLRLNQGQLSAQVPDGAEGFTVETSAGEVIDLGTRFGVSVNGETVEAHVFEGEIKVNPKRSNSVHLHDDEAITLNLKEHYEADAGSFPMPTYPLEIGDFDGGFESESAPLPGVPDKPGIWSGDTVELSSGSEAIQPLEGNQMVRFVSSRDLAEETEKGQQAAEIWQLVDLSNFADEVNHGGVSASLSAAFNRVAGDSDTDTGFGIGITAFRGAIPEAAEYWKRKRDSLSERLSGAGTEIVSDSDESSWENASCDFAVPPGSDFLMIQVFAFENVKNDQVDEFAGHFIDAVKLDLKAGARGSRARVKWAGSAGNWNRSDRWENQMVPDGAYEEVVMNGEECLINSHVVLKQSLTISSDQNSSGNLHIGPEGHLEKSGAGQLIVGYNEGAVAEVLVNGVLQTSGPVFIGRNNKSSSVTVSGGTWESRGGIIRMAQYGDRGADTQSLLHITNRGKLIGDTIEMIHDLSEIRISNEGVVHLQKLRVGGADGSAAVRIENGTLRVQQLEFGPSNGSIEISGPGGFLEIEGEWNHEQLLAIPHAKVLAGKSLRSLPFTFDGKPWTRFYRDADSVEAE